MKYAIEVLKCKKEILKSYKKSIHWEKIKTDYTQKIEELEKAINVLKEADDATF